MKFHSSWNITFHFFTEWHFFWVERSKAWKITLFGKQICKCWSFLASKNATNEHCSISIMCMCRAAESQGIQKKNTISQFKKLFFRLWTHFSSFTVMLNQNLHLNDKIHSAKMFWYHNFNIFFLSIVMHIAHKTQQQPFIGLYGNG